MTRPIICFRHKYDGEGSPTLSCKVCCDLYIATVKVKNGSVPETEWVTELKRIQQRDGR